MNVCNILSSESLSLVTKLAIWFCWITSSTLLTASVSTSHLQLTFFGFESHNRTLLYITRRSTIELQPIGSPGTIPEPVTPQSLAWSPVVRVSSGKSYTVIALSWGPSCCIPRDTVEATLLTLISNGIDSLVESRRFLFLKTCTLVSVEEKRYLYAYASRSNCHGETGSDTRISIVDYPMWTCSRNIRRSNALLDSLDICVSTVG